MEWWGILLCVLLPILGAIGGFIGGLFFSKKKFEKQLKENPPVTEQMIRVMFQQMGRKASENQIKQVMRSMKNAK
ncbi:YneF family protein [[Mycoplasma] anseris]|uniref:YneF family protein n=1 Tax=[Mycoplasma] anseris TaxID=92400 RepID=A0A2Z4NDD3_9BACT|nr:YneF family protein [[Mycoplasma] anseris]AWX69593.1 YneF family protein [[Mycoplasma] anseris]